MTTILNDNKLCEIAFSVTDVTDPTADEERALKLYVRSGDALSRHEVIGAPIGSVTGRRLRLMLTTFATRRRIQHPGRRRGLGTESKGATATP